MIRTAFAADEIKSFLSDSNGSHLVESYLVQYLLIAFYSEFEEKVKDIIRSRLSKIDDRKVSSFVFKTNEGMIKRVKKTDLNDILSKFDCGDGDIIKDRVGDINLQPYFDVITNRHLVSHNDGSSMTLRELFAALDCAEAILNVLETELAAE